ncbi:binding-protein-dependent transporter [Salmonella enterica subsp. enterica]|uniref:Binding-protein-dependent transporter n=1 Tax=Salmonella enterica I TaxID=59201 RepID=A0A3S4HUI4_SALET|nr:binding-protein-dependent transporter [Salmonella enterica subsp. enterica]
MLWAPVRFGANTINFATTQPFPSPPSAKNWLGTDANGGDVFARILYGTRISILFGLMLTICSSVMGVLAGRATGLLWRQSRFMGATSHRSLVGDADPVSDYFTFQRSAA